jgi:hypothetical protein
MTPFIRGRILAEVESTGQAKRSLDVLVWLPQLTARDLTALGDVCILKDYLASLVPRVCDVLFHVPSTFSATASALAHFGVPFLSVQVAAVTSAERAAFKDDASSGLLETSATAISRDCDLILIREPDWFAYWRELDEYNLLAVDCDILKRQCELFVRGHDLPWSFTDMTWHYPWTSFYMMAEHPTFQAGLRFLEIGQKKKLDRESMETARMLVYNRLPNLCFTRDRLLFYELQRRAAKRAKWTRQKYLFEMGYYLEFYYLRRCGLERKIEVFPPGPVRDWARGMERFKMRLEKSKKVLEDVLFVQIKGKAGFIHPMSDIEWNFGKFHSFMSKVLEACLNRL